MFRKRGSSRIIFLPNFQNFWQSDLLMKSSGLQLLWIPILSQQAKKFSKLEIKQPPFWCLYYDISTCFFVFEWRVRSLVGSFFVKFQVFSTNIILLTTDLLWETWKLWELLWELCHIVIWKFPKVLAKLFFISSLGGYF